MLSLFFHGLLPRKEFASARIAKILKQIGRSAFLPMSPGVADDPAWPAAREPDTRRNLRLARFRRRFVARPRYAAMRRYALHPPGFRSPHRKRSIAATGGVLARRPLKTNMRPGGNATFEILARRTKPAGKPIKKLPAA